MDTTTILGILAIAAVFGIFPTILTYIDLQETYEYTEKEAASDAAWSYVLFMCVIATILYVIA